MFSSQDDNYAQTIKGQWMIEKVPAINPQTKGKDISSSDVSAITVILTLDAICSLFMFCIHYKLPSHSLIIIFWCHISISFT